MRERSSSAFSLAVRRFMMARKPRSRTSVQPQTGVEAGFLQKFAGNVAAEIERPLRREVCEIGRAARKIDHARARRRRRHDADEIGAVGGLQRRGGENVEHAGVGKFPIAPRQEAGIVRLEA